MAGDVYNKALNNSNFVKSAHQRLCQARHEDILFANQHFFQQTQIADVLARGVKFGI